jgi:hypothetical protein
MSLIIDPRRRYLLYPDWPVRDKELWAIGMEEAEFLETERYASTLRPASIRKARDGYSRWLGLLKFHDDLVESEHPADRVILRRVREYFRVMRALGNSDYTILGRLQELRMALKILAPERNFDWIRAPGGRSVHSLLVKRKRSFEVPDSGVLYNWGLELMLEALKITAPVRRRVQFRDGLLIAIFAARAPRLGSVAKMRFGWHVVRDGDGFRIIFEETDTKNTRHIEYLVPKSLIPCVERYIQVERVELLNGQTHDAFWVNWDGKPLDYRGIDKRIRWWSAKRFGKSFGPHRFRHALGTTAPRADPANQGLAVAILAITSDILEEHYNRAEQAVAATRFHADLKNDRARTKTLARQAFGEASARYRSIDR